ncbi:MAG: hypothetical protein AAGA81_13035, partial [Acidobacteriota bacterium]
MRLATSFEVAKISAIGRHASDEASAGLLDCGILIKNRFGGPHMPRKSLLLLVALLLAVARG